MNNRKLRFTVLSILVLVLVSLLAFTGCKNKKGDGGDDNTPSTEIYIEKSLQPRLIYVEGQELDLSTGALTVAKGDEKTRIPFSDSRISISGYNKHTIGNQTLTVSYEGKTTTLTVAVIARMTVENAEVEYFTGEAFNKNKGRVKIAKDDATTSYVDMKSDSITVKSFNNTEAGSVNVTIQYSEGSNVYECSFPVTFYTPAKIDFKKPNKNEYLSHEESLDFRGGYIYLEAAKPSTFKKSINITEDMVSGYSPASVTDANKDEALEQTVTVSYSGRQWEFKVNVLYSPIYVIEGLASKLGNVDSYLEIKEGETMANIKLPEGVGEAAKEAIIRYFSLSSTDRELVDSTLILNFARVSAFYINTHDYINAANALNDAFILNPNGQLLYVGKSYESVQKAITALEDPNSDYNATAALMLEIKDEFGEEQFNTGYKISQLTSPHTEEIAQTIAARLRHIINVYDGLKTIPNTWETELSDTKTFADNYGGIITDVVFIISSSEFVGPQFTSLYSVVTKWRSDFFSIIYSYYYYAKDGGKEQIYSDLWGKVPAPGLLEEFYATYNSAYSLGKQLTETSGSQTIGYDLYQYIYFYYKTLDISKQIKESGNELYTTVYNALNLDAYIDVYLNAPSSKFVGFYDFVGPVIDNPKVMNLIKQYYEIIAVYATTGEITNAPENKAKITALFNGLVDFTPSELHWFLSAVSYRYHDFRGALLLFDLASLQRSFLAQLLYGFIAQELPHNTSGDLHPAQKAFSNLLLAMEVYPTSQYNTKAIDDFKKYMNEATNQYNLITDPAQQSQFNSLVGKAWEKYNQIYNSLLTPTFNLEADMLSKFDELYNTLDEFNSIIINSDKMKLPSTYPMLMALYQKAKLLYDELYTASESQSAVKKALNAKLYTFVELEDPEDPNSPTTTWSFTVDMYYYYIKSVAYGSIIANGHLDYINAISDLLLDLLPLFRAEYNNTTYTGGNVTELINKVRALSDSERMGFYLINADLIYYSAINRYTKETYQDQTALNPGVAGEKIDELMGIIKEFVEAYSNSTQNKNPDNYQEAYPLMVALYMKAKVLYNEILTLAGGDAAIMNALNYKLYTLVVDEETSEGTVDEFYLYVSYVAYELITSDERIYAAANIPEVQDILIKVLPVLRAEFKDTLYTGTDIYELLAAVRNLKPSEKYGFYVIQGNLGFYAGLEKYISVNLSEAAKNSKIVSYLFNAEIYYSLYELDNNDTASIETFKTAMENAINAYASLSTEDKALLDDLYYNDLLAKYNALFPAQSAA